MKLTDLKPTVYVLLLWAVMAAAIAAAGVLFLHEDPCNSVPLPPPESAEPGSAGGVGEGTG